MKPIKALTIRTSVFVLLITISVAFVGTTILQRQMENMVQDMVAQQLHLSIRPWLQQIQAENGDLSQLVLEEDMLPRSSSFSLAMIQFVDPAGHPRVLWSSPHIVDYSESLQIAVPTTQGQLRLMVWSPEIEVINHFRQTIGWIMVGVALIAALAAFAVTHWNMRPFYRLIKIGTQMTHGSFEQSIDVDGCLEVRTLSQVLEQVRLRFRQLVSGAITQAMIWEGSLELFPLSQLLMMLRFTSQTGVLVIMDNIGLGRIYVEEGRIRGAAYKDQKGFRAFYALFLLDRGDFKFNPRMKPFEDELQTASWYSTLLYATRRVHSLQFIEQYVPDMRFVPRRARLGSETRQVQKDLTQEEWQLLQIIDGEQNVRQLAKSLRWTPERVQRYLYRFAVIGLIESQLAQICEPPPQNVVSLWARAAWKNKNGGA